MLKSRLAKLGWEKSLDETSSKETINEPLYSVVLGFNVDVLPDAKDAAARANVSVFVSDVIFGLIEEYQTWFEKQKTLYGKKRYETIVRPGKFKILPGFFQAKQACNSRNSGARWHAEEWGLFSARRWSPSWNAEGYARQRQT